MTSNLVTHNLAHWPLLHQLHPDMQKRLKSFHIFSARLTALLCTTDNRVFFFDSQNGKSPVEVEGLREKLVKHVDGYTNLKQDIDLIAVVTTGGSLKVIEYFKPSASLLFVVDREQVQQVCFFQKFIYILDYKGIMLRITLKRVRFPISVHIWTQLTRIIEPIVDMQCSYLNLLALTRDGKLVLLNQAQHGLNTNPIEVTLPTGLMVRTICPCLDGLFVLSTEGGLFCLKAYQGDPVDLSVGEPVDFMVRTRSNTVIVESSNTGRHHLVDCCLGNQGLVMAGEDNSTGDLCAHYLDDSTPGLVTVSEQARTLAHNPIVDDLIIECYTGFLHTNRAKLVANSEWVRCRLACQPTLSTLNCKAFSCRQTMLAYLESLKTARMVVTPDSIEALDMFALTLQMCDMRSCKMITSHLADHLCYLTLTNPTHLLRHLHRGLLYIRFNVPSLGYHLLLGISTSPVPSLTAQIIRFLMLRGLWHVKNLGSHESSFTLASIFHSTFRNPKHFDFII